MKCPTSISRTVGFILGLVATVVLPSVATAETALETMNREVVALYDRAKHAIVKVHASRPYMATARQTVRWQRVGTGFFIDANGTVLTTSSVADEGESFWIEWENQKIPMKLVGSDPLSRLAVLKIDAEKYPTAQIKTPVLPLGNPWDLQVGSMVILVGYLYNLPSSPSVGFVGGFDIRCGGQIFMTSHIRSTTRLSPGQQGGPLLNVRGQVVGIPVSAHLDDQSYAIPIDAAKRVWTDLLKNGRVDYGWIGVKIAERRVLPATGTNAMENVNVANLPTQVVVTGVVSNTPAARAGVLNGDIVVRVHTNDVRRVEDVLNTMFGFRDGDKLPMNILRGGEEKQFTLTVEPLPPPTDRAEPRLIPPQAVSTNDATSPRELPVVPASADPDKP
jgi:serine protease Do